MILIRLRTRDGMLRCSLPPTSDVQELWAQASQLVKLPVTSIQIKHAQNGSLPNSGVSIQGLGLKHGDLLNVDYTNNVAKPQSSDSVSPPGGVASTVVQDEIDNYLEKQNGLIKRSRDPKLCRHGDRGMCEYCSPLEPFDPTYLEENKIKHMSFHAYLRKVMGKKVSPTDPNFIPPLTPQVLSVLPNCTGGHSPWPAGICSKCQPSAVSLQRQAFRMVDHIEFETPQIVETVLEFWRGTGSQRFAYLYGRFLPYDKVPLGVKAVVSAVYEPMQENASDGLKLAYVNQTQGANLEAKSEMDTVDEVARSCGLSRVGMIFTDLQDDGTGKGGVVCKRHKESFFLSSLEACLAARFQSMFPISSKYSSTGKYGSRFITCVISGNAEGGIEVEAYQVSETAVAMVQADLIEPSIAPQSMLVQPEAENRYVPEIIYQARNEYGTLAQHKAAPAFPVDYLLVNVTHGFPSSAPTPYFAHAKYPPANRLFRPQTSDQLARTLHASDPSELSDFQFLVQLGKTGLLSNEEFKSLCLVLCNPAQLASVTQHPSYTKLCHLISKPSATSATPSGASASSGPWNCRHCTFQNIAQVQDCEMCGLPK